MFDVLREYKEVMLELLLTATIIGVLASIGYVATRQYNTREEQKVISQDLKEYRELSMYDRKELTGNDIMIALKKYSDLYNIYISTGNKNYAFRRVCVTELEKDIQEHYHKTPEPCITIWLMDDLDISNSVGGNTISGYKVTRGGVGGSSLKDRELIYSPEYLDKLLGAYLSNNFEVSLKRWNYDETMMGLNRSIDKAVGSEKKYLKELKESYERRKDDITGLSFKLKVD